MRFLLVNKMTETHLVRQIAGALKARGAWVVKLHGGPMQQAGLPDLLVVHPSGTWLMEVKLPGGNPTRLQRHVMDKIAAAGGRVVVVRSVEEALKNLEER